jgi:ABC-type branched-subunit amino acid transport system substrate-binding protein
MDMATEGTQRKVRGRKDADKQEAITQPEVVSEKIDELVRLYGASQSAGVEFSDAVKAAAEASGYNVAAIRKFVVARAGENFAEKKRDLAQQLELFEECGE